MFVSGCSFRCKDTKFKQITTRRIPLPDATGCSFRCKDTKFKQITTVARDRLTTEGCSFRCKDTKFKQITTGAGLTSLERELFFQMQRYEI